MPVTADGGVMKKILKKSTAPHDFEKGDDNPDDLSHVKVHYRAPPQQGGRKIRIHPQEPRHLH